MNNIMSEKEYQDYILDRLKENGYSVWKFSEFDRLFAVHRVDLFKFLNDTQPDKMEQLKKILKG